MADHVLAIGALRTAVSVLADPEHAEPLRGRLDRAVSQRLPPLLSEAVGRVLDRHDGVVRLRSLRLQLEHAGPFDEDALARLLAARIADALGDALTKAGDDVRAWPDGDAYLAAYVETRLGLPPGPAWPFEEFRALALLAPSEAAVAVLRARPALLAALARSGAGAGDPARVLAGLDDVSCAAVLEAVAAAAGARTTAATTRPTPVLVAPARVPGRPTELARAALDVLLRAVARAPGSPAVPLVRAAMAAAAVAHAARVLPAELGRDLAEADLSVTGVLADVRLPAPFRAALDDALTDRALRRALVGTLPAAPAASGASPHGSAPAAGPDAVPAATRHSARRHSASPVAGLALLLPGVVSHRLAQVLTPPQLRAAALSTLGEEAQGGAATDPLLAVLFPADPFAEPGPTPVVPTTALQELSAPVRPLTPGRSGVQGWGDLLLATFADRLPGLRGSSRGYLQRQFLQVPGRLEASDDTLLVTLDGPPLAVVLAMAGLDGDQAPLPHLGGRRLVLVLTGLRR